MDLIFVQNFFHPFFSLHQSARIETCARSFENVQNSPRSVILCIHRLADRPIDTLSLLFTWSGLRARIFSAIRITVPVTGKYRNEFPFNFSLPSSPFIQPSPPVSRYLPPLSPFILSLSLVFAYCSSTDRVSKHLNGSKQGEARDERLFTIPKHVHRRYISKYGAGERDGVALLEGIGRRKRATISVSIPKRM